MRGGEAKVSGWRGWSARRRDALLTAAVVLFGVADSWVKPSNGLLTGLPGGLVAAVSGAVGLTLWWSRRWPGQVAAAVLVGYVIAFTPAALAVALYRVGGAFRRVRTLTLYGAAGCIACAAALWGGRPDVDPRVSAFSFALVLGPLIAGYVLAVHRDLAVESQVTAAALERERHLVVERAQTEERARIARELHDVVAHHVSNIVLTAGALGVGREARAPAVAHAAELIRDEGQQALQELREVLAVLAPDRRGRPAAPEAATPEAAAEPGAAQLEKLVARAAALGRPARLHVDGHPEVLPPPVQRAVHRIVQEGLTNAAKHAPGAQVDVVVACLEDGVTVRVANGTPNASRPENPPAGGGHGLIGLAERVSLLGGTFTAGGHDGGYRIEAFIPTAPAAR